MADATANELAPGGGSLLWWNVKLPEACLYPPGDTAVVLMQSGGGDRDRPRQPAAAGQAEGTRWLSSLRASATTSGVSSTATDIQLSEMKLGLEKKQDL